MGLSFRLRVLEVEWLLSIPCSANMPKDPNNHANWDTWKTAKWCFGGGMSMKASLKKFP